MAREHQLEVADNLNDGLGDHIEVEFTSNRYTSEVRVNVNLGDVWTDSSKGTSASWDSDAEKRIAESIVLNLNGEVYDVPSELVNFLNTYNDGIEYQAQIDLDFLSDIKGEDFSTAQLELDLRNVSDLSSSGTYQEGTSLEFVADESANGRTSRMHKISDSVQSLAQGQDQFDITQRGEYDFFVIEDTNGILDHVNLEAVMPGDEEEVVDQSTSSIRNKNVRDAGTSNLDSNYYLIDAQKAGVDPSNVNRHDFDVETNTSGSVKVWTYTQVSA